MNADECICGADSGNPLLPRRDIVCPKHDGVAVVTNGPITQASGAGGSCEVTDTLTAALAHAELIRRPCERVSGECGYFEPDEKAWCSRCKRMAYFDVHIEGYLTTLADEVSRQRRSINSLERAIKLRDTFLSGDAAAVAYADLAAFVDIMFTGAHGRQMTPEEVMRGLNQRCSEYDKLTDERDKLSDEVLRLRGEAQHWQSCYGREVERVCKGIIALTEAAPEDVLTSDGE